MIRARGWTGVCVGIAALGCGAESDADAIASQQQELAGVYAVFDRDGITGVSAVGEVDFRPGNSNLTDCSGTLTERRDRFITAAHCLCSRNLINGCVQSVQNVVVTFPQAPGFSATGVALASPTFMSASDLADVTDMAAPDANDVAIVLLTQPVPATVVSDPLPVVELGNAYQRGESYERPIMAGVGTFGTIPNPGVACTNWNEDFFSGHSDDSRRFAFGNNVRFVRDQGGLLEAFFNDRAWLEQDEGNTIPLAGDSGGPLFVQDRIVGIFSGWYCNPTVAGQGIQTVWASPGIDFRTSAWLGRHLGRPLDATFSDIAIYGERLAMINDRARVLSFFGAPAVVAGESVSMAVDSQVERVVGGFMSASDRALVNNGVKTFSTIARGNAVTLKGIVETHNYVGLPSEELEQFRNFLGSLTLGNGDDVMIEPGFIRSIGPGSYRSIHIKSGGWIILAPGMYFADSVFIEPNAKVQANTAAGPVRIFSNRLVQRASIEDLHPSTVGNVLFGVAGPQTVMIEANLDATVIAPNALINITGGWHAGQFIGRDVLLHQNLQVHRLPFRFRWRGP